MLTLELRHMHNRILCAIVSTFALLIIGMEYQSSPVMLAGFIGIGIIGNRFATFNGPSKVHIDYMGQIIVNDFYNKRIVVYRSFTDDGPRYSIAPEEYSGQSFSHAQPFSTNTDAAGRVYIADRGNHHMVILSDYEEREPIATIGGAFVGAINIGSDRRHFWHPSDVTIRDDGRIYVADAMNNRIQVFASVGELDSPQTIGQGNDLFDFPCGIDFDSQNNLYVADTANNRVQIFDADHVHLATIGSGTIGNEPDQFDGPLGIAVDAAGQIYVADTNNDRIQIFSDWHAVRATESIDTVDEVYGPILTPYDVAVDAHGRIYVAEFDNNRVSIIVPTMT